MQIGSRYHHPRHGRSLRRFPSTCFVTRTSSAICQSNIPTRIKSAPHSNPCRNPRDGGMAPAARTLNAIHGCFTVKRISSTSSGSLVQSLLCPGPAEMHVRQVDRVPGAPPSVRACQTCRGLCPRISRVSTRRRAAHSHGDTSLDVIHMESGCRVLRNEIEAQAGWVQRHCKRIPKASVATKSANASTATTANCQATPSAPPTPLQKGCNKSRCGS